MLLLLLIIVLPLTFVFFPQGKDSSTENLIPFFVTILLIGLVFAIIARKTAKKKSSPPDTELDKIETQPGEIFPAGAKPTGSFGIFVR